MSAAEENPLLDEFTRKEYEFGFTTDIDADKLAPGLNERCHSVDQCQKERTGVDAAMEAGRLSGFGKAWKSPIGPM